MSAIRLQTTPKDYLPQYSFDAFQILEVSLWTLGLYLADIGTFAVSLLKNVLLKTHIKWVSRTRSEIDAVRRLCYILKNAIFE